MRKIKMLKMGNTKVLLLDDEPFVEDRAFIQLNNELNMLKMANKALKKAIKEMSLDNVMADEFKENCTFDELARKTAKYTKENENLKKENVELRKVVSEAIIALKKFENK